MSESNFSSAEEHWFAQGQAKKPVLKPTKESAVSAPARSEAALREDLDWTLLVAQSAEAQRQNLKHAERKAA